MNIKSIFAASAIVALTSTVAMAGGYATPVVEETVAAVVEPQEFSWTGAYAGVSAARTAADLTGEDLGLNGSDSTATYGVLGGYRHQYTNNIVAGVEGSYTKSENLFEFVNGETVGDETYAVEAQVGYAFDRVLPYAAVGYAKVAGEEATTLSAGVDYAITDNFVAGVKYTNTDLGDYRTKTIGDFSGDTETVAVRAIYKF